MNDSYDTRLQRPAYDFSIDRSDLLAATKPANDGGFIRAFLAFSAAALIVAVIAKVLL